MRARVVVVSERQRAILERIGRSRSDEQRIVERAAMLVLAAGGMSDVDIGRRLGVNAQRPRRWRRRWIAASNALTEAEGKSASDHDLETAVRDALADDPRSGGPVTFQAEQVARIISLACEPPADSELPINRWTPAELANEAVKRGIVESISPRHLDRLMKRGRSTPA